MPKQIYKVDQFHGGLNSSADARDIGDNEFTEATDVMFDSLGRIRTMGGTTTHDAPTKAVDVEPGYGLFTFSHDRQYGHLGEHLNNTGNFSSNWAGGNGWTLDSTDASYAHHASPADLIQVQSSRRELGVGSIKYVFTYTISSLSGTVGTFRILGGSGQFANANTDLTISNGTHIKIFVSKSDCASNPFTIDVSSSSGASFNLDNVSLVPFDTPELGDDYMVLSDDESSDTALYIYSQKKDVYGTSESIPIGTTADYAPAFYYVDGALRASDSNFGSNNSSIWYGYVNRKFFPKVNEGERISQWVKSPQSINPPSTAYFDQEPVVIADGNSMTRNAIGSSTGSDITVTYDDGGGNPLDGWDNVYRVYVKMKAVNPDTTGGLGGGGSYRYTLTVEDNTPTHTKSIYFPDEDTDNERQIDSGEEQEQEYTFYFDAANDDIDISPGSETLNIKVTDIGATGTNTSVELDVITAYEGVYDILAHTALNENNVWLSFDDAGTGTGWDDYFHVGVSFIYDDSQESQITQAAISSGTGNDILSGLSSSKGVNLSVYFEWTRLWDKRITGINVYLRKLDSNGNVESQWYKQANLNFITGNIKTANGVINPIKYDDNVGEYFGYVPNTVYTSPLFIETYQTSSGVSEDAVSTSAKFKTAVVANRMAYIGNVEIEHRDGRVERKGDAILKSPVNRFDVFPSTRIIEASVQDGDEIIKLEEYADRLLEFKRKKMELINISQDLEFLEDTFIHKGVSHPAATCKTDYGIAWVNIHGCYLYDGKQVNNLLEKSGRQIIDEDEWDKFLRADKSLTGTRLTPMIGYLPRKRQLIIYDDISNTSTADPRMYLYDMVTASWTKGAEDTNRKIDTQKTNFINDWNGDLVYAYQGGITLKWDDTSDATDTISFKTKDLDLGQPGQRKKIYKAYVSYRGDGTGVTIQYSVNGDRDTVAPFYRCAADGSSDNTNSDTTPLNVNPGTDDWVLAELKPVSAINNVYSFQLVFDGTAAADFEINDISIVYRLKNVR